MLEVGVSETQEKKNVVLLHDDAKRWMMSPLKTNITYAPRWIGAPESLRACMWELRYTFAEKKGAVFFFRWTHVAASAGNSGVQEWRRQKLPLQAKGSGMIVKFGWHLRVGYGLRREAMRYGFRQLIFIILNSWNYCHVRGLLAVCIGAVISWIILPYIVSLFFEDEIRRWDWISQLKLEAQRKPRFEETTEIIIGIMNIPRSAGTKLVPVRTHIIQWGICLHWIR